MNCVDGRCTRNFRSRGAGRWVWLVVLAIGMLLGLVIGRLFPSSVTKESGSSPALPEFGLVSPPSVVLQGDPDRTEVTPPESEPSQETRPDSARWLPRMLSLEGNGRTSGQIFDDFWQGRHTEADFPPDYKVTSASVWDGYLGDPDQCLLLLREALVAEFRKASTKGGPQFQLLGIPVLLDGKELLKDLAKQQARGSATGAPKIDLESVPFQELATYLDGELRTLLKMRGRLLELQEAALRADVASLDAWTRPARGHLHFGPIQARNTFRPEVTSRIRQPEDLWALHMGVFGGPISPECRAYNAVYLADWQDFPEVAAEIEAILGFLSTLEYQVELRFNALPTK